MAIMSKKAIAALKTETKKEQDDANRQLLEKFEASFNGQLEDLVKKTGGRGKIVIDLPLKGAKESDFLGSPQFAGVQEIIEDMCPEAAVTAVEEGTLLKFVFDVAV